MGFRTATDQLIQCITLVDIAEACGSAVNSIERARLNAELTALSRATSGLENGCRAIGTSAGTGVVTPRGRTHDGLNASAVPELGQVTAKKIHSVMVSIMFC